VNLLTPLHRPEYLFRPWQILRRLRYAGIAPEDQTVVTLPWGVPLRVRPGEMIGRAICKVGLDDLPVCETIWRLIEPGSLVVDVGASLGQITSLMAVRAGAAGRVIALEPHPATFAQLERNHALWCRLPKLAPVDLLPLAASDRDGRGILRQPPGFEDNLGLATLQPAAGEGAGIHVATRRLDSLVPAGRDVELLKIDVAGHEQAVLDGAAGLLARRRIRHIVYEEHRELPNATLRRLEALGFTCLLIDRSLWRHILHQAAPDGPRVQGHAQSVLATLDIASAMERLRGPGWRCLRGGSPG
jgi:FkbM family methyltransferase